MTTTKQQQQDALTKAGFKPAESQVRRRLIVSVEGEEKTGKNNWAFTAPDPIAVFSFDQGVEGVVEKFINGKAMVGGIPIGKKEIFVKEIILPPSATGGSRNNVQIAVPGFNYEQVWSTFVENYQALLDAKIRTIIWDTATEVYELQRLFRFGKLSEVPANMWGPVKAEYRELIRRAYNSYSNLILLNKVKPVYNENDKRIPGKFELSGFNDIGYVVQINIKTFREDLPDGGSKFSIKVLDCRQNAQVNGVVYEGRMCTFPKLAENVIEGTDADDWE